MQPRYEVMGDKVRLGDQVVDYALTSAGQCSKHGAFRYCVNHDLQIYITECPYCAAERNEQERMATLRRMGLTKRFEQATFGTFVAETDGQKEALRVASDYAANFDKYYKIGRCLIFVGRPGTGKTHLALSIARVVVEAGHKARKTTVGEYIRQYKDYCWVTSRTKSEREILEEFGGPDLLVLDEVGVQFGSAAEEIVLFNLVNKRYEDMKPTLVVSNGSKEDVIRCLGERAFDRLREGGGLLVPFTWESYRGQ